MDDMKLLPLMLLLCCGAPILILLVPPAVVSIAAAVAGEAAWYLAAGVGVVGLLLWRFHQRWSVQRGREATGARRQTAADPWGSMRAE